MNCLQWNYGFIIELVYSFVYVLLSYGWCWAWFGPTCGHEEALCLNRLLRFLWWDIWIVWVLVMSFTEKSPTLSIWAHRTCPHGLTVENSLPLDNFGSSGLKVKLSETVWSFAGFFVRRLPAVCLWYLLVETDFCQNSQLITVFIILELIAFIVKQLVEMNENAPGWLFSLNAFPLTFLWCAAFASLISCLLRLYGSFACGWYFSKYKG